MPSDSEQRAERVAQLRTQTLELIPRSRVEGTRTAEGIGATDLEALGDELTRLMLNTLNRVE